MIRRSMKFDDRCLLFFIKYPEKGGVKSRLAAEIGEERALLLYKDFVLQMLSAVKKGSFVFFICFYPENALDDFKKWLGGDYEYLRQKGENLGERMKNGFIDAFNLRFKRVALIGSDIPDLPVEVIEEAFRSLHKNDVVIGPAFDGGYYLIGFKDQAFSPEVFEGIDWGTKDVFAETIEKLKRFRRAVHTLPYYRDIDTAEDLKHLKGKPRCKTSGVATK